MAHFWTLWVGGWVTDSASSLWDDKLLFPFWFSGNSSLLQSASLSDPFKLTWLEVAMVTRDWQSPQNLLIRQIPKKLDRSALTTKVTKVSQFATTFQDNSDGADKAPIQLAVEQLQLLVERLALLTGNSTPAMQCFSSFNVLAAG